MLCIWGGFWEIEVVVMVGGYIGGGFNMNYEFTIIIQIVMVKGT